LKGGSEKIQAKGFGCIASSSESQKEREPRIRVLNTDGGGMRAFPMRVGQTIERS